MPRTQGGKERAAVLFPPDASTPSKLKTEIILVINDSEAAKDIITQDLAS